MARCNNEELIRKVSLAKLKKSTEIDLALLRDLPDCRIIKAKAFSAISGTYTWDNYSRPVNRFECMPKGCTTSGTLNLTANETVTYRIPGDAREVSAGVITFYVKGNATATVKISETDTFTNADVYTVTAAVADDGYAPVVIDLTKEPTSEEGNGWTPAAVSYVQISLSAAGGISTLGFFEAMEDFELNQTVKLSCMSSIGGTFDIPTIEARCAEAQYDENVNSVSFPVTAALVSSNWLFLNPLMGKGTSDEGFMMTTVKKTVEEYASGGKNYGRIILTDAAEACSFYSVQRVDGCDPDLLTEISMPTIQDFDVMHFQKIESANGVELIFNADLVSVEMLVSYPKAVEAEEYVFNTDNLNEVRTRMTVPYMAESAGVEGVKYVLVANNVLVTSVPFTVTDQDTSFPFTFTILRDQGGDFIHLYKVAN